jgi:drug/metabolite transporter (DMT)-like permease
MAALKGKALAAYLVICVVWGSTYLAIKVGVRDLPPFTMAGIRFLIAGLILLAIARLKKDPMPRRRGDMWTLAIVGLFLLVGGNTFVIWGEQYAASGVASIFVVTCPLWMALFEVIIPGGTGYLNRRIVIGLILGFIGIILLVGTTPAEIFATDMRGPLAFTISSITWAFGSVYSKRRPVEVGPYMGSALQLILAGIVVGTVGIILGEWSSIHLTAQGLTALAYLIIFGSVVSYSAYMYALHHGPTAIVGTYAYVNPVIAVVLGWLFLSEPITGRILLAMVLILAAVIWIQFSHKLLPVGPQESDKPPEILERV